MSAIHNALPGFAKKVIVEYETGKGHARLEMVPQHVNPEPAVLLLGAASFAEDALFMPIALRANIATKALAN